MFRAVSSAAMPIDVAPILGPEIVFDAPVKGSRSRQALMAAAKGANALVSLLDVNVDAELLDQMPAAQLVANFAVGTDNIDIGAASARGICVTNTPEVLTEATADFAFALLLAAARRLPECDELARSGNWAGWQPDLLLGAPVAGSTIGIVGMGRIGRAVAARARGFSMRVLYTSRSPVSSEEALGGERKTLVELAAASDFVTLHCPLTPETEKLVDGEFLARMKPTATLINTARGACVDEAELVNALESGVIASAGLDVFSDEPHIPETLRRCKRVILAPHAGSATTWARSQMATICARAVRAVHEGRVPETAVNPEAWAGRARKGQ